MVTKTVTKAERAAGLDMWELFEGVTTGYDAAGDRVVEISERVTPNMWNGHTASNVRSWVVFDANNDIVASGTADGLRASKVAAREALAERAASAVVTTKITYSDGADTRTTEHTDAASAWDMLATIGRQCTELGAAINEAAATGYALQSATFAGMDDGVRHAVTVVDVDSEEASDWWADALIPEQTTERRRYYAMRRPVLEDSFPDNVVTQGDADYCRDYGHAFHTVDGVDTGTCPRCGNVTPEVYDASRAILRGTEVEYLHIGTRTWRRATVESFRASDAAYVLRTQYGTDAAPARHVHTLLPSATVEGPVCAACGDATCTEPGAHHTVTELPRAGATLGAPVLAVGDAVNYHAEHSSDWKSGTVKAVSIGLQAVVITTPDGGDEVALLHNVHRLDTNNGETAR